MFAERMGNGLGDSIGMSVKYPSQPVINKVVFEEGVFISDEDKVILRETAKKVAEYASRPIEEEKKKLWYAHNDLKPVRPLIFCDPENGWYEIVTAKDLKCKGNLAKIFEFALRKEIAWAEVIKDDKVISDTFKTQYIFRESGRGRDRVIINEGTDGSYIWEPLIKDYDELDELHFNRFEIDYEKTNALLDLAKEIFDGILKVQIDGCFWQSYGLTSDLIYIIGLERMLYDMYDEPEGIHKVMRFLTDEMKSIMDFAEENGLLTLNNGNTYVGSGGFGFTNQLPRKEFDGKVRTNDLWGHSESQETSGVSPQMYGEFVYPYQKELWGRFGLNCYGCCEALHTRWDYVKTIPNLRRVSVSSWADDNFMAEAMGNKYVFSKKVPSAWLALPDMPEESIYKDLTSLVKLTRDCNLEIVMKDNHSIANRPDNLTRYVEIVRQVLEENC